MGAVFSHVQNSKISFKEKDKQQSQSIFFVLLFILLLVVPDKSAKSNTQS